MTPGRRYLRDASASANPSTACPATIFVTLSAQHGVRSRSWWNCIAMDASNPTLKKHTEVFSTTSRSPSSSSLPSNEMSSKPSARKSTLPPRLWFARRPNPMPLFVGSVGYFADAVTEGTEGAPLRHHRRSRSESAARAAEAPPPRWATQRSTLALTSAAVFSRQLAGAGARVGRCPPRFAAFASLLGDGRAPGGVSGGGANASVGRCGRSSFAIAIFRASCKLSRRPFSASAAWTSEEASSRASGTDRARDVASTSASSLVVDDVLARFLLLRKTHHAVVFKVVQRPRSDHAARRPRVNPGAVDRLPPVVNLQRRGAPKPRVDADNLPRRDVAHKRHQRLAGVRRAPARDARELVPGSET